MTLGHVALVGAMGSGKTTIGVLLASRLRRPFLDNDVELQRRSGDTPADATRAHGIDALHRLEASIVLELLDEPVPAVITAAASTVLDPAVRDALRAGSFVVWLHAGVDVLADRLTVPSVRPDFGEPSAELVARQAGERSALFQTIADADFDTSRSTPEDVVDRICALPQLSRCVP